MTKRKEVAAPVLSLEEKRAKVKSNMAAARDALAHLWDSDHAFIKPEFAAKWAEAFGIEGLKPQVMRANVTNRKGQYTEPKGLFVDDLPPNSKVEGFDARDLADLIAGYFELPVPPMFGRGSGLRAACGAIEKMLDEIEGKVAVAVEA